LGAEMRIYLPHFMASITIWNFISSSLSEACYTLIGASGMIKAVEMPLLIHVMRMVQRNLIIFLHNIAIIPIIWIFYPWQINAQIMLVPFGLLIVYIVVSSSSMILSMICVRYRDVPPIVPSVMQLLFFVSPIIWIPSQIKGGEWILTANPIAYLLTITRDPLMGNPSNLTAWFVGIGIAAITVAAMAYIYTRYRTRVVFWV
jgi:lipopolysaccharide transport system permease protein